MDLGFQPGLARTPFPPRPAGCSLAGPPEFGSAATGTLRPDPSAARSTRRARRGGDTEGAAEGPPGGSRNHCGVGGAWRAPSRSGDIARARGARGTPRPVAGVGQAITGTSPWDAARRSSAWVVSLQVAARPPDHLPLPQRAPPERADGHPHPPLASTLPWQRGGGPAFPWHQEPVRRILYFSLCAPRLVPQREPWFRSAVLGI